MGFSAPAALTSTQTLPHTWLNYIISGLHTVFDHGIEPDYFTYPLVFEGLVDFNQYKLLGVSLYNGLVFADSYDTLADAIADLSATGGMVILGPKEYTLTSTLDLSAGDTKTNVLLVGMGPASKLTASGSFTGTRLVALSAKTGVYRQRMGVYNLSIDTQGTDSLIGIDCANTEDSYISGVYFQDDSSSLSKAINLNECSRAVITHCDITQYYYGIYKELVSAGTVGHGPTGPDLHYHISDNIIHNCTAGGIHMVPPAEMMVITNNVIESIYATCDGIHLEDSGIYAVRSFIIDCNIIAGIATTAHKHGIYIKISSASATSNNREYSISNNVIRFASEHGIYVEGTSLGNMRTVPIYGNYIYRPKKHGIYLYGYVVGVSVVGNNIFNPNDTSTAQTYSGVFVDGTAANTCRWTQVQNNIVVYSVEDGINQPLAGYDLDALVGGTGVVGKCMLCFNVCNGTQFGLLQATNGNTFESNIGP